MTIAPCQENADTVTRINRYLTVMIGVDEYETDLGSDPSGEVRICGVKAPWAHIQQRSKVFRNLLKNV